MSESENEENLKSIHRLHITGIGDRLVYATDYDDVDHQYGETREVCLHPGEWELEKENVVHIEYGQEKDIDGLPPMLVDVESVRVIEQTASPDFLLDL